MTTRPPATHRPHAQPVATDDAVFAKVAEASAWSRQNSRALLIGLIILAIAVVAAIYYVNYRGRMAARAATELLEVRQTAATGDVPTAIAALEGYVSRFGNTPAGAEARLLLAQLHLAAGNAAQAAESVRPVVDADDPLLATSAGLLMAGALEASGQPEQAEQAYMRVAEDAEMEFQRREALEDAARIRVERGDRAGAVEIYDQLIGLTEEGSAERDVYEMRRTEITAGS